MADGIETVPEALTERVTSRITAWLVLLSESAF
jgi:hypothetical protein